MGCEATAASVVLAARQNGYSAQESRQAVVRGMQRYSFAEAYADQAERDHAALLTAITEGRVQAQTGV